jgi:hypothetical protein
MEVSNDNGLHSSTSFFIYQCSGPVNVLREWRESFFGVAAASASCKNNREERSLLVKYLVATVAKNKPETLVVC